MASKVSDSPIISPQSDGTATDGSRDASAGLNSDRGEGSYQTQYLRKKVAVLVVHGVNAQVPDRQFSNLEAVTDLLTNHDFTEAGIGYSNPAVTNLTVTVGDVPRATNAGDQPRSRTPADAAMEEALNDFPKSHEPFHTQRRETSRTRIDGKPSAEDLDVHLYELFWADLSRPGSFSGLNSALAFVQLLFNLCSLGTKSLAGARAESAKGVGRIDQILWTLLSGIQGCIERIVTLGLPLANVWLIGAAFAFFPLTLSEPDRNALIPTLAGFFVIVTLSLLYYWRFKERFRSSSAAIIAVASGLAVCGLTLRVSVTSSRWAWLISLLLTYCIIVLTLVGCLYFSRYRRSWPFWSMACALMSLLFLCEVGSVCASSHWWNNPDPGPLRRAVMLWADWAFAGSVLCWVALAFLNFAFAALASLTLWRCREAEVFEGNRRALWTSCISNSVPAVIILVLSLGLWHLVCLALQVDETSLSTTSTSMILPLHEHRPTEKTASVLRSQDPLDLCRLRDAAAVWHYVCKHPWIQYAYLYFIVAVTLAAVAMAPQIWTEASGYVPPAVDKQRPTEGPVARWFGEATDGMFAILRLSGEVLFAYMVLGAPLVLVYAWVFRKELRSNPLIPAAAWWAHALAASVALALWLIFQFRFRKRGALNPAPLLARTLVVGSCLSLPLFPFVLNITWALGFSALLLLAGSVALFRTVLNVALDVLNWLRLHPTDGNPRSKIVARLSALLAKIVSEKIPYTGLVIVAHSQGTVITVEFLRYLDYLKSPELTLPVYLFTMGCPLQQLYSLRFPDLYEWVGHTPSQAKLKPLPSRVRHWSNAYATADYIGRNLWTPDAHRDIRGWNFREPGRAELCLGRGAHIRYWNWRCDEVAKELDRLICAAANDEAEVRPGIPPH
jgi:hypothetical protein